MRRLKCHSSFFAWLGAVFTALFNAHAQTVTLPIAPISTDFASRVWHATEGPQTTIARSIAIGTNGSIWVGTFDGLVHMEGDRSVRFTPDIATSYKDNWIITLMAARGGELWVGTAEGLRLYEGGHWTHFPASANPPSGMVESLAQASNGDVYVSIATNSYRYDGRQFRRFPTPFRRPEDTSPTRFVVDGDGRLWARTDSCFARFDNGQWRILRKPDTEQGWIRGIGAASRTGVWVVTDSQLLRYRDDQPDRFFTLPEGMREDWATVHQDSRGAIWVASFDKGIAVFGQGDRVLLSGSRDGLSDKFFALAEDASGNIYAASNGQGMFQFRPRRASLFTVDAGGGGALSLTGVENEGNGSLIASTIQGSFYQVSSSTGKAKFIGSMPGNEVVDSLLLDHGGHLWAGTENLGLWRSKSGLPKDLEKVAEIGAPVNTLYEDAQHNLWVGTGQGALVYRGGNLEPVNSVIGTNVNITGFAGDSSSRVWIATAVGLFYYRQGAVSRQDITTSATVQPEVVAVHVDYQDDLWVGLRDGSFHVRRDDKWLTMAKSESLQTAGIGFFTEDKQGRIWIACRQGLFAASIKDLEEFMKGNGARPPISRFTDQDDLHDQDFNSSSSAASCVDDNGFLWFANGSTLARIDTRSIRLNMERPEVSLTDVLVGNKSQFSAGLGIYGSDVKLPHDASPLTLRFQARAFTSPENVYYEYRSQSTGGKWIGNGRSRELRYADVRPGNHTIEVRAVNSDGLSRDQGSIFSLYVRQYPWEMAWFQASAGIVAVGAAFAFGRRGLRGYVRRREAHLSQREAAARAELQRVSQEADRMRLEARLQESQRLEALGTLAGGIAHDFNNLLQSILGNAELGRLKLGHPTEIKEHLDEVIKASDRARALVAQILLFSRREKPQRIPLFAGPIVKESLKLLRSGISPNIQISTNIPDQLPPVLADPSAIQRIVTNLGTNAAHSMRERGGTMVIKLEAVEVDEVKAGEIGGIKPGEYVCLTVSDTGHGMDLETQRRVFEPFFTTKAPGEGTGLGLSVVQGLVHSLEGAVRLRSEVGVGSQFDIFLPVTKDTPSNNSSTSGGSSDGTSLRVLVVDDDSTVLDFAVAALRHLGHRPEGVLGAEKALAQFRRSPVSFDMIVTDLTMPGMDGKEFARAAKASRLDIPIILATGYGQGMDEAAAEKSGFEALMPKPYNLEALAAVIRRVHSRRLN